MVEAEFPHVRLFRSDTNIGFGANFAKWMETTLYRFAVIRNSFSRTPVRRERGRHHHELIALIEQAWKDTRGGHISPQKPW